MALSSNARLGLGALTAIAIALGLIMLVPRPQVPEVVETKSEPTAIPVSQSAPIEPVLDTLRVEPDGTTVLAGHAEPNQKVAILLDGTPVEEVTADASGAFVAFPPLGMAEGSRTLTLVGDPDGTSVKAGDTYLIAPMVAPSAPAATLPDTAAPEVVAILETPAAPTVIAASPTGVRVLQSGGPTSPDVLPNVALDSITYDPSGDVLIAGRAQSDGFVQIYLDNQPITTSRILTDGNWQTDLPDIDTGIYTLRVDEIGGDGIVISRVETPFQREDPNLVAAQMAGQTEQEDFRVAVTTVQPGTTLWAIATERFGEGIMYVKVFEANRDRIRDPDLIYPGQVFRIPE